MNSPLFPMLSAEQVQQRLDEFLLIYNAADQAQRAEFHRKFDVLFKWPGAPVDHEALHLKKMSERDFGTHSCTNSAGKRIGSYTSGRAANDLSEVLFLYPTDFSGELHWVGYREYKELIKRIDFDRSRGLVSEGFFSKQYKQTIWDFSWKVEDISLYHVDPLEIDTTLAINKSIIVVRPVRAAIQPQCSARTRTR